MRKTGERVEDEHRLPSRLPSVDNNKPQVPNLFCTFSVNESQCIYDEFSCTAKDVSLCNVVEDMS